MQSAQQWRTGPRSYFRRRWCGSLVCLLLCMPRLTFGQDATTEMARDQSFTASDSMMTIFKRVDEVNLIFTVTDKKGRFVDDLQAADFHLLDNNRPPKRVYNFQTRTDLPLVVALLVDISSSIQNRFSYEQKAATMFLKNVLRPGMDRVSVISFGSDVQEVQPMTGDMKQWGTGIQKLRAGGETALYDAIILGSQSLRSQAPSALARKVMIILTDGADTASRASELDANEAIAMSEAMVLVVDASIPSPYRKSEHPFFKNVTSFSGGTIVRAEENWELQGAFRKIEKVLRTQYALSYKPSDFQTDGSYRSIQLTSEKRKLIVHCRAGYYAQAR
jgi:VWFA-related protein